MSDTADRRHPDDERPDPSVPYDDGGIDEMAPGNYVDEYDADVPEPNEPA